MTQLSIRWRLTLWFWLVLLVVMMSFALVIYSLLAAATEHHLSVEVSEELKEFGSELKWSLREADGDQTMQLFYSLHTDYLFEATSADGERRIAGSEERPSKLVLLPERVPTGIETSTRTLAGWGRCRIGMQTIQLAGKPVVVAIAVPLEPYDHILLQFRRVLVIAGLLMLLIALGAGYFLACRALSPVQDFCRTVEQVTAERLDERIKPVHPTDELGRLAATFNAMLERLERSFEELRIFTADAAHELRTPLAVLRSTLDVASQAERSPQRYAEILRDITEDVERLSLLADRLLLLSKEDSGISAIREASTSLAPTITGAIQILQTAARKKGISIEAVDMTEVAILADAERLTQVWINLLDNAIKYSPEDSHVTVRVSPQAHAVGVIIEDTGNGIPADQVDRVFDRFYRVDPSRNRVTGGAGLGLAICKAIVMAHGGTIKIAQSSPEGTAIVVTLPLHSTMQPQVSAAL